MMTGETSQRNSNKSICLQYSTYHYYDLDDWSPSSTHAIVVLINNVLLLMNICINQHCCGSHRFTAGWRRRRRRKWWRRRRGTVTSHTELLLSGTNGNTGLLCAWEVKGEKSVWAAAGVRGWALLCSAGLWPWLRRSESGSYVRCVHM